MSLNSSALGADESLVGRTPVPERRRRTATRVIRVRLPLRALAVTLAAAGLGPTVAVADTPIATPQVSVGSITVPPVTVPSVTIPPIDVPSVSTPVVTTPPVHVPSITTPSVSTPPVTTPPVRTPPVQTPPVKPPVVPVPVPVPGTPVTARASASTSTTARAPAPATPVAGTPAARTPAAFQPAVKSRTRRTVRAARRARRAGSTTRGPRHATTPVALDRRVPTAAGASGAHRSRPAPAVAAGDLARPSRGSLVPGAVEEIVDALPRWVIGAFVGFALIAMLMAINAYLSSRRARALGVQRAALLDDVGLLQTALLAPVPALAGDAQVSVAYRPAAGPAAGGDFYDVISLGPGRTGLLLGDVSGHGREALRHAALVRYTVRTFLAAGHEPADALARADECLDADLEGHFATVIAAVYDHDTHALRYAKAGHHPPVILGAPHDPDAEPFAPPLGAGLGVHPEPCELTLDPGSTVCMFTDGLIEARRDGALLGRATLVELLHEGRPDGPELLDRVVERADEISDDLAVCVLRRP
jgi:hypothetical protein